MKGLIYRELYLGRKKYILGGFTFFLFVLLGILIRLSMIYGNLAQLEGEAFGDVDMVSYYIFACLTPALLFIALSGDSGVAISDFKSKWCLYAFTLPVTEAKLAAVKYVIKIGMLLISLVLGTANIALFCALSGRKMDGDAMKLLLIVMLITGALGAAVTPLTLKYKSSNAVLIRMVITCIILFFLFIKWLQNWFMNFQAAHTDLFSGGQMAVSDEFLDAFMQAFKDGRDKVAAVAPVILILSQVIGYLCTLRQLRKREIM